MRLQPHTTTKMAVPAWVKGEKGFLHWMRHSLKALVPPPSHGGHWELMTHHTLAGRHLLGCDAWENGRLRR